MFTFLAVFWCWLTQGRRYPHSRWSHCSIRCKESIYLPQIFALLLHVQTLSRSKYPIHCDSSFEYRVCRLYLHPTCMGSLCNHRRGGWTRDVFIADLSLGHPENCLNLLYNKVFVGSQSALDRYSFFLKQKQLAWIRRMSDGHACWQAPVARGSCRAESEARGGPWTERAADSEPPVTASTRGWVGNYIHDTTRDAVNLASSGVLCCSCFLLATSIFLMCQHCLDGWK